MIYNCQHCGGWFTADTINAAIKNRDSVIRCDFCGQMSEIGGMRSSNVDEGFKHLKSGNFYDAGLIFALAKDESKYYKPDSRGASHDVSYEAHLGEALAQARVQVIYSEDDPERRRTPRIICHKCNEQDLADNASFIYAKRGIENEIRDYAAKSAELDRLEFFSRYVDGIKDEYKEIKEMRAGKEYSVFIAYEDDPQAFSRSGYEVAIKIKNNLPDELVRDVFLPDIEEFGDADNLDDRIRYEAAILYALENSKCMLVVSDSDIDSRLIDIYSRFYFNNKTSGGKKGHNLGFIRYCGEVNITLPDKSLANSNVFNFEDTADYNAFARAKNNIFSKREAGASAEIPEPNTDIVEDISIAEDGKPYTFANSEKFIYFGSYPQKHVTDRNIEEHFAALDKPNWDEDNGWTPLHKDRDGYTFTWYKDEKIENKLYRGVYFMSYRDVYSVQDSDVHPTEQKLNKYMPRRVYCFEFAPIVWNIADMSSEMAVLVSSFAIDSMEYNNYCMNSEWCEASINHWLNTTFKETAFTKEESEYLCRISGAPDEERVHLVDKRFDFEYYYGQRHLSGSDYYKCVGGKGNGVFNDPTATCYWIKCDSCDIPDNQAMTVHPGAKVYVCNQYVDCSTVAVVPKIILRLA